MAQRSEQEILNASYIETTSALRVGASLSFSTDAANNRVSAIQTVNAGNLLVSGRSDDAGLFRVSALGVNITDVTNTDAGDFHVSAYSGDGNQLHVSAVQGDAGLLHTSSFVDSGSVSAMQGAAENLRTSCFQLDAGSLHVSAFVDSGSISAVQGAANNLRASAFVDSGSISAMQTAANNLRVSCFQTTANDLMNTPSQGDAALLHTSAFVDSGSISAMQGAANNLRVSALVDSGSISAMQGVADNLRVSAFSIAANTFMVSGRSDDAGLFRVSTLGTVTVSAHEVKQSDAASLRCSALVLQAGDPTYTVIDKNGRCSATGGVDIWTPTAGKSARITDAVFSSLSANVMYLIGAGDAVVGGPFFFAANGGCTINAKTPITLSANEVLGISADNANSIGYFLNGYEV